MGQICANLPNWIWIVLDIIDYIFYFLIFFIGYKLGKLTLYKRKTKK